MHYHCMCTVVQCCICQIFPGGSNFSNGRDVVTQVCRRMCMTVGALVPHGHAESMFRSLGEVQEGSPPPVKGSRGITLRNFLTFTSKILHSGTLLVGIFALQCIIKSFKLTNQQFNAHLISLSNLDTCLNFQIPLQKIYSSQSYLLLSGLTAIIDSNNKIS